jgi:hypothetical protein
MMFLQKCWIENCGELKSDKDWGIAESDGTADKYPPYPADWDISCQDVKVNCMDRESSEVWTS